mgnify:CR=1 FL=1
MDQSDYKLLGVLQQNARTTIQDLADHIGASTASVQRRLKAMRDAGVIQKEVAILDQQKLGFGITAVVSVELERDRLDQIDAFKKESPTGSAGDGGLSPLHG